MFPSCRSACLAALLAIAPLVAAENLSLPVVIYKPYGAGPGDMGALQVDTGDLGCLQLDSHGKLIRGPDRLVHEQHNDAIAAGATRLGDMLVYAFGGYVGPWALYNLYSMGIDPKTGQVTRPPMAITDIVGSYELGLSGNGKRLVYMGW